MAHLLFSLLFFVSVIVVAVKNVRLSKRVKALTQELAERR
jgi:hypothetical protein